MVQDRKLIQYPDLAGQTVDTLLEDREGTVWAGGQGLTTGLLCAIQNGRIQCHGEDGTFGKYVESLYEDSVGNLWAGAEKGVWRWKPGPPKRYLPDTVGTSQRLNESDNGALLIVAKDAIKQFVDGKPESYRPPGIGRQFIPNKLFRDRNGGLWIGTLGQGLLHVHQGKTDVFAESDGLSGNDIERLYEDREGNIWVVTPKALIAFATSPSRRFLSGKVCLIRLGPFLLLWMAACG
jgi:ligand-binding sensor domain-containing protein